MHRFIEFTATCGLGFTTKSIGVAVVLEQPFAVSGIVNKYVTVIGNVVLLVNTSFIVPDPFEANSTMPETAFLTQEIVPTDALTGV